MSISNVLRAATLNVNIPFGRISRGLSGRKEISVDAGTAKVLGVAPHSYPLAHLEIQSLLIKTFISSAGSNPFINDAKLDLSEMDRVEQIRASISLGKQVFNVCDKFTNIVNEREFFFLNHDIHFNCTIDLHKYLNEAFSIFEMHLLNRSALTVPSNSDCWIQITPGLEPLKFADKNVVKDYLMKQM
jgi:hypothetical protein